MIPFSDSSAVAKVAAAVAKRRANGTLNDKNRGNWAIGTSIPFPPSTEAMNIAAQVFDVAAQYGTSSPTFTQATRNADAAFSQLKPGWLGSILGAIATPVFTAIATTVTAGAATSLLGSSTVDKAKSVIGATGSIVTGSSSPIGGNTDASPPLATMAPASGYITPTPVISSTQGYIFIGAVVVGLVWFIRSAKRR